MSEFKLTTVEEFEAATARLLETGAKVGADAWQIRAKNQTPHCKFGEQGICCRVQWDRAVLHRRLQEESADVMLMVS